MENYLDEYNYLLREQQIREGNVEIDRSGMFKGLEMTDNYKQMQNSMVHNQTVDQTQNLE